MIKIRAIQQQQKTQTHTLQPILVGGQVTNGQCEQVNLGARGNCNIEQSSVSGEYSSQLCFLSSK